MITSLALAGWKILTLLALGFCLALGVTGYASRKMNRTRGGGSGLPALRRGHRLTPLWNTAPSFTAPGGYDPNAETHKGGRISKVADAAIAVRWSLVTLGATTASVKLNIASTTPIGVVDDTTDTLNSDLTIPVNVNLFGGTDRTMKVAINSSVTQGDWLIPDSTNPYYGMTDPATASNGASLNRFGRALQSGVAGQGIEFEPLSAPTKVAYGKFTSAGSLTSESITVAGLLTTDIVVASLAGVTGSEKLTTAVAAAGQINLVYSANSGTSTVVDYAVFRA